MNLIALQNHPPPHPAINNSEITWWNWLDVFCHSLLRTSCRVQSILPLIRIRYTDKNAHTRKCQTVQFCFTWSFRRFIQGYPQNVVTNIKHHDGYSSTFKTTLVFYVCHNISHHISCQAMLLQYYLNPCYYNVVTNPFIPFISDM